MSTLVGGTGIIGQDIFCSFGNGKYTTFEGTEIVAENCLKARVKDLVVEGKTYQNLFGATLNQGHVISDSASPQNRRVNSDGFTLDSTTYTICVPSGYQVLVYVNYGNNSNKYIAWANKIIWTNSATTNNIRIMVRKSDDGELTVDEVIGKVILLEGDYTNIDLPTSIDGIESVGERENNVLNIVNSGKNIYNPNNLVSQSGNVGETIFPPFTPILERNKVIFRNASRGGIACKFYAHKNDILYLSGTVENLTNIRIFTESANFQGMGIANFNFDGKKTELNPNKNNVRIPEDGYYYIRCWIYVRPKDVILTNFMAQLNSQYSYEPYRDPTITTINLPIPLRSLPNGVADTIEGDKLVQRVGKVVLDENTEFNFPTSLVMANTVLIGLTISSIPKVYDSTISAICDKLQFKNIYSLDESGFFINKTGTNLWLRLSISIYGSTLEEIKTNLALNPITIYYPLATPIIHNLEILSISTTKGTNIITTTNNIKPKLKLKVKVK